MADNVLRVLRREIYGTQTVAAEALKISRRTLIRAELGQPIGTKMKRLLEHAFDTPFSRLMTNWLKDAGAARK